MRLEAELTGRGGAHPYLLVGGGMAAVFLGAALAAVARALGMEERASLGIPLVLGLAAMAFAVWYARAPQGRLRADAVSVAVKPLLRAERVWVRDTPPVLRAFQLRTDGVTRTAGPLLELRGMTASFTVGALDPRLGARLPPPEGLTLLVPPDYLLSPDDFRGLCRVLGVHLPDGG